MSNRNLCAFRPERSQHLQITSSLTEETDIARTLIRAAELGEYLGDIRLSAGYDAIAIATHGRSGLKRWLLGSVTEHVLDATTLPIMIIQKAEEVATLLENVVPEPQAITSS